jgi:hypothetical protein
VSVTLAVTGKITFSWPGLIFLIVAFDAYQIAAAKYESWWYARDGDRLSIEVRGFEFSLVDPPQSLFNWFGFPLMMIVGGLSFRSLPLFAIGAIGAIAASILAIAVLARFGRISKPEESGRHVQATRILESLRSLKCAL